MQLAETAHHIPDLVAVKKEKVDERLRQQLTNKRRVRTRQIPGDRDQADATEQPQRPTQVHDIDSKRRRSTTARLRTSSVNMTRLRNSLSNA